MVLCYHRLPKPSVPTFEGTDKYIADIPIIAVISFAQSVSLAAMMAKKHKYSIDSNQVCAFFNFLVLAFIQIKTNWRKRLDDLNATFSVKL